MREVQVGKSKRSRGKRLSSRMRSTPMQGERAAVAEETKDNGNINATTSFIMQIATALDESI
jgi:hypothetical protein